jgi:hypothetical protein
MIPLMIVAGIVLYVFGGLVIFRICEAQWHSDCRWSDHFDCGQRWASAVMGLFWPIAPPLVLLTLALWRGAVVVSDMFTTKEDN